MILIVDDDICIRTSLSLLLKQNSLQSICSANSEDAINIVQTQPIQLVIMDMNYSLETSGREGIMLLKRIKEIIPDIPVILITGWGSIPLAVEGMKAGAFDFINKPWNNKQLLATVKTALTLFKSPETSREAKLDRKKLDELYDFKQIVGEDPKLLSVLETIGRVSSTDASILIMGESGTGKELIAESIHQNSLRNTKPFVKVNLGGISSSLFESEMFGHKRGSFTDAKADRIGRFEMANKGSIFLDEIGDLDLNSQVKLLRVLQDGKYEVLGDSKTKNVDVRVICATNRDLETMVSENKFREDLFYRINLITIRLPSLRERPSDIPLLVENFIKRLQVTYNRGSLKVSSKAMDWLKEIPFTGNIRELKNLVERTVIISKKDTLDVEDFSKHLSTSSKKDMSTNTSVINPTIEEMEVLMIKKSMEHYKQNISKVAKSLGLSRGALYRRLEKYSIPYEAPE